MNRDDVWRAIDEQRRALVDLLEGLSDEEWAHPSLCAGWTVREVAAHVASQNTTRAAMARVMASVVRHGGLNGAIRAQGFQGAQRPTAELIAAIRDRIGVWKPLPFVTYREAAIDYVVHTQDIAIPLGRSLSMPTDLCIVAADRVWSSPAMFHARRRFSGYRFEATDADWRVGEGVQVTGPIGALLLLLTGRPIAVRQLSGPGASELPALVQCG